MRFGVREGRVCCPTSRPTRASARLEVGSQELDIRDEVLRRVRRQVDVGLARVRRAATTVALIEQDDAVLIGIEERAVPRCAAGAGSAVKDERGAAVRVAAGLPIHLVAVTDREHAGVVGLDPRM